MDIKKVLLKYPALMFALIVFIFIFGIVIAGTISNSDNNEDDIEIEEPQEEIIIPYTNYDWSKLNNDSFYTYEDDNYYSMFGIDVAAHQDKIDWKKVKQAGVEFAYIRLGYRGATEGLLHTDLEFENNYKGAVENNIKVGVYWYAQPISEEESVAEAEYVIDVLDGRKLDLPIVYDFEETEFSDGTISRMHDMKRDDRTSMAVSFLNEIKKTPYESMIYTNLYWSNKCYDWTRLSEYPIWFAQYDVEHPDYDRPFVMWQYTDRGEIEGINEHYVDFDIMFIQKNNQN